MVNHPSLITPGAPGNPGYRALMTKEGEESRTRFQPKIFIDSQEKPIS
jgi:hypothetical protein